jgi:hypothetical protein
LFMQAYLYNVAQQIHTIKNNGKKKQLRIWMRFIEISQTIPKYVYKNIWILLTRYAKNILHYERSKCIFFL